MPIRKKKIKLGELLVENKLITPEQLANAIKKQEKTGERLGSVLVGAGYIKQDKLLNFLAQQFNISYIDLNAYPLKPELMRKIPESLARRYRVVLLDQTKDGNYLIGMVDPQDIFAYH